MTFLEFVNKLLDEIQDKKSLDFKSADKFINKINNLKYNDNQPLTYDDKVKLIDLLKSEAEKRGLSFQYYINDSSNSRSMSVISFMTNKINPKPIKDNNIKGAKKWVRSKLKI